MFQNPVDICNRALQHCGIPRISDFSEDSLQASEVAFAYDKVRRSELRRNLWQFSTRKVALRPVGPGTMYINPVLWSSTTTYGYGAIVTDSTNVMWQSRAQDNLNNAPGNSAQWELYCGPIAVFPYDTTGTTSYYAGEVVYKTPGDGTYTPYLCLQSGTSGDPAVTTPWDATVTYSKDQVVVAASVTYASLIDFNLNQNPASAPALWAVGTTYAAGASVGGSDGNIYTSIGNGNTGNDPTATSGFWTNTGVLNPWTTVNPFGTAADAWLQLSVALTDAIFTYPLGSGPSMQSVTRNIFRLPANFLRRAPQDPKAGSQSFLGAPTGLMYDDWELEGAFIVSREVNPIVLRFVADMTDVTAMDDLFCEMLAAQIALQVVERLTQSTAKKAGINADYAAARAAAITVNGIEVGAVEPPEDEYVACRI